MGGEIRRTEITITTRDRQHFARGADGERPSYDDVHRSLNDAVRAAVDAWYQTDGHKYLRCEPDVF